MQEEDVFATLFNNFGKHSIFKAEVFRKKACEFVALFILQMRNIQLTRFLKYQNILRLKQYLEPKSLINQEIRKYSSDHKYKTASSVINKP